MKPDLPIFILGILFILAFSTLLLLTYIGVIK